MANAGSVGERPRPTEQLGKRNTIRRMNIMRLYYIDESEGPTCYVRSALGVDAERWNDLFADIQEWRGQLQERHAIPTYRELHACDLLAGRGMLGLQRRLQRKDRSQPGGRGLPRRAAAH